MSDDDRMRSGFCIDGPRGGELLSHNAPYFEVAIYDELPVFDRQPMEEAVTEHVRVGLYRWVEQRMSWYWEG